MTTKLDFLGECNDQGIPLEDFRLAFCIRCFQKDCTRSQFGTSRFEARVNTWEDRLFRAPQLPKNDPRYAAITAKRFLTLAAGPIPSVREWVDPKSLAEEPKPEVRVEPPAPVEVEPPPVQEPVQAPPPVQEAPKMVEEPPPVQEPKQNLLVDSAKSRLNTPYSGPMTLPNAAPSKDAWVTPSPLKPGEKVVKPGARVKMGGSG